MTSYRQVTVSLYPPEWRERVIKGGFPNIKSYTSHSLEKTFKPLLPEAVHVNSLAGFIFSLIVLLEADLLMHNQAKLGRPGLYKWPWEHRDRISPSSHAICQNTKLSNSNSLKACLTSQRNLRCKWQKCSVWSHGRVQTISEWERPASRQKRSEIG